MVRLSFVGWHVCRLYAVWNFWDILAPAVEYMWRARLSDVSAIWDFWDTFAPAFGGLGILWLQLPDICGWSDCHLHLSIVCLLKLLR